MGTGLSVSRIQTERRDLGREGKTRPEGKVVKYRSRGLGWGEACGSVNVMGLSCDPLRKECTQNVILFGKQNCFSCNYDEVILEEGGSLTQYVWHTLRWPCDERDAGRIL